MTGTTASRPGAVPQLDDIRTWVLSRVAYYIERTPAEIDPDAKLVGYGLDSVYALSLCGDIEDEYALVVDPTLAWDHPTVNAIATCLLDLLAARARAAETS
ncbi:acyl carrier protein [Dactylosporangium sp. NBC_01737]|uniref:acyl carrier protein n=1 Tax=Dactylosporangium sp. NBC_01737 TaxID=2975959 RepID=UPI002E0EBB1F|nr:acyl carrier protein [Dactylosporangium sp. NBC_01737]